MMLFDFRGHALTALLVTTGFLFAFADAIVAAEPKVESITPSVFSLGETRTVKIIGDGLESALELVFYEDGLKCLEIKAEDNFEATAKIQVSKDAKLGSVPFRVLSKDGFSNVKTLRLTDLPLMLEPERGSNDEAVDLDNTEGVAIYGTLERGQYDRYSIELEAGQSFTAVVDAVRLGGTLLDTVLKVYDPSGNLAAFVDDTSLYRQDPYLHFTARSAGRYIIEVHETNYDGSDDSHYLLYVGDMPTPAILFPPGGPVGEQLSVRTVPDSTVESEEATYQLPPLESTTDGWFSYRPEKDGKRAPTAVRMRVSPFANVIESSDNNVPKSVLSEVNSVPAAFCGIVDAPGDVDCFAFHADAGSVIRFESFAERIGAPIDTLISILDSNGNELVSGDDWMCHDSLVDFKPNVTGTYVLQVTDKLGNGFPHGVYRVEATETRASVTAFLPRPDRVSQAGQSIAIPQGNRALVNMAVRRELIEGDAAMKFDNLPQGINISTYPIPSDRYWMPMIATASDSSKIGGALANVAVEINQGEQTANGGFSQAIDLVAGSADTLFYGVHLERIPVAVVEPVPFRINLEAPKTTLAKGGTIALKIRAERNVGFDEPLIVKFPFLPSWVTCEPEALIPAGTNEVEHVLTAYLEAEDRTWPMVVTAEVDVKNSSSDVSKLRGKQVASELVDMTIAETPITGKFEPIAAEQGQTLNVICACKVNGPVPQKMTATLEGLPNRVTCESVEMDSSDTEITFAIILADDAPVGTFTSLACRLSGQLEGQSVSYVVANETTLQVAEPGKLVRGPSGELLSPLEALKQKKSRP